MTASAAAPRTLPPSRPPARLVALLTFMLTTFATAATPAPITVAPHRAVYDLSLASGASGSFSGASGTMTWVISDVCSAWSTQQHMELDLFARSGETLHSVGDNTSLETKDGLHLTFASSSVTNGQTDSMIRGEATLARDGTGAVSYILPEKKTVPLRKGTLFPTAQNFAILEAAQHGETGLSRPIFDGTTPDGAEDSYATLLGWTVPKDPPPFAILSGLPAIRFHLASYASGSDDMTPDFEMAARLFANGVSDQVEMTFSSTRILATLRTLEMRPAPTRCPH
ncbi:EipB family protein [Acetobacter fallax]|uniref:DUF1849 family protein n=1 Tax=Acetobacter fallax TaxID=1737473 RepID=A0ABX0K8D0_9PROT|nr:DUF1849 family protein [Acetobacter fallax]NHO32614.1 DUF1849 family protein [Acetobacter fallax]NHO36188.1 DUF1849 family protein [Acetobacter fallax]